MDNVNSEVVNAFLKGRNPMERIISMECGYMDDKVSIIYINDKGHKTVSMDDFKPFVWAKNSVAIRMCVGDRKSLIKLLNSFGIGVKALKTKQDDASEEHERLKNGYKYLFYAKKRMTYNRFLSFFSMCGTPIYDRKKDNKNEKSSSSREFLAVTPVEQHMILTGKRLFKGYNNYDDLKRLQFDLETQGLRPEIHGIDQIGIRTNKGYEKIITITGSTKEERNENELKAIEEFISILRDQLPDVIAGHNSENFDWNFMIVRCKVLGTTFEELTSKYFKHPIHKRKKETILKLGGEMEYYFPTIMWGTNIVDSLHAVRRAQAIDSNMKLANLKYVTKYLELNKANRVYVPGDMIGTTWLDTEENYGFNEENGDWYKIKTEKPLLEGYVRKSGRYIVERYLLDDIWETDKVELKLNEANFLIGKLLPTTFQRACTMGTAGIWKLIMLAWCFENNLAIPAASPNRRFTGGLSRLLKVGYVDNVVKLDYNSLYPSIILTWKISTGLDITHVMLSMLDYVLTEREKYKGLKSAASKESEKIKELIEEFNGSKTELKDLETMKQKWDSESAANDKKQLPLKILGNSFFGGFGSPDIFPFGDLVAAEKTTCIGRMSLRLMISHFSNIGYSPIVGDSFTSDTPLFVKNNTDDMIDIKPISELINEKEIKIDALGREYDYSTKNYKVLCRSGWHDVNYIYRHKTNKPIYTVEDDDMKVEITEDHSLFNSNQEKIKPSEINDDTKLEFYSYEYETLNPSFETSFSEGLAREYARNVYKRKNIDRIPKELLNSNKKTITWFLDELFELDKDKKQLYNNRSKTFIAGIQFLTNKIK